MNFLLCHPCPAKPAAQLIVDLLEYGFNNQDLRGYAGSPMSTIERDIPLGLVVQN